MKIYFAASPGAKDHTETLNKAGAKNRLFSFYYLERLVSGNRRKKIRKEAERILAEREKKTPDQDD